MDSHNKRIEISFSRISSISVPLLKQTFNPQKRELVEKLDFSNYVFDHSDMGGNDDAKNDENKKIMEIIKHFH